MSIMSDTHTIKPDTTPPPDLIPPSPRTPADIDTDSGLLWSNICYDLPIKQPFLSKLRSSDNSTKHVNTSDCAEKASNIDIGKPGTERRILNGLSGHVKRGEFVGILGASGAGKTTLLNALSGRMGSTGQLSGQVLFDGKKREADTWKRVVGYVQQDDALLPRLTVRETIEMSSKLRLPDKSFSAAEKQTRAEEVLDMLRLEDCAESRIGNEAVRGVSGGERKRTSIGIELVSDVVMLFLDEPTSGLDAYAAMLLVTNVSRITKDRQLASLMTVHQPSWAMFSQLDRVILMAKGGVYYEGPPREAVTWFKGLGYDVPEGVNPADHFISIAEESSEGSKERVKHLLDSWVEANQRSSRDLMPVYQDQDSGTSAKDAKAQGTWGQQYPTTAVKEFSILLTRWWWEQVRDTQTLYASIGQTVILLILIGFGFFRLENTQDDVLPKIGVLFFIPINASFSVLGPLVTAFPLQRALMKRERASGLYRASTSFLSKVVLEVPMAIVQRLLYYTILYFMVGLRLDAGAFFIYLGINCLYLVNSVALALAIGAASPTVQISQVWAPLSNVIFLLFGGTFLPSPPPWFVWIKWISPITYIFSATIQNEFAGQPIECRAGGGQCYASGDSVIQAYNAGTFNIGGCAGLLVAITSVFLLIGYLGLKRSTDPRFRIV